MVGFWIARAAGLLTLVEVRTSPSIGLIDAAVFFAAAWGILRVMNMLYEAIREKGSMAIVPSPAAERRGFDWMLSKGGVPWLASGSR
jgi:hypothetical protein